MPPTVPRFEELIAPPDWRTVDFISDLHLQVSEPATATAESLGEALEHLLYARREFAGRGGQVTGERGRPVDHVLAQPRDGRELDAVGLFVHADPGAEIRRVDTEFTFDVHHVRRDQQQAGRAFGREIVLAEHLARHEGHEGPRFGAGHLGSHAEARGRVQKIWHDIMES